MGLFTRRKAQPPPPAPELPHAPSHMFPSVPSQYPSARTPMTHRSYGRSASSTHRSRPDGMHLRFEHGGKLRVTGPGGQAVTVEDARGREPSHQHHSKNRGGGGHHSCCCDPHCCRCPPSVSCGAHSGGPIFVTAAPVPAPAPTIEVHHAVFPCTNPQCYGSPPPQQVATYCPPPPSPAPVPMIASPPPQMPQIMMAPPPTPVPQPYVTTSIVGTQPYLVSRPLPLGGLGGGSVPIVVPQTTIGGRAGF